MLFSHLDGRKARRGSSASMNGVVYIGNLSIKLNVSRCAIVTERFQRAASAISSHLSKPDYPLSTLSVMPAKGEARDSPRHLKG